jgi:hypothetical protein
MTDQLPAWMQGEPDLAAATVGGPLVKDDPHPPIQVPQPTQLAPERFELLNRLALVETDSGPFKALIYGPKGVGKTVFCCRAPNCILIAAEPGQKSLNNHPELRQTPVLPVKSFNDLDEIAWAKREGDLDRWVQEKFGKPPIVTFIIDTASELAIKTASELLDKAWARDQTRNRFMVSQAEYRVRNELFRRLTADYVDLGVNFILTAHESEVKDEADGRLYLRPDLSDTMAASIGGLVDLQGRLTLEDGPTEGTYERVLQVHPTRRVDAKTRIGGLPLAIRNPSIQALIDASQRADVKVPEGATA